MSCYVVKGGNRLSGEVNISGAKNAVLPILAAASIQNETTLKNVPFLSDVSNTLQIIRELGLNVVTENNTVNISGKVTNTIINKFLSQKMRSSILFLGAILGKCQEVTIFEPGGCKLGERPIDLHIWAMEKLGAKITKKDDEIICKGKLKGTQINMPIVSVGVTENIIMAAINAEGITIINNCAKEPEIDDLILYLNECGNNIERKNSTIIITPTKTKNYTTHCIIPDRIEAATFMAMAAATKGELFLKNLNPNHLNSILNLFQKMGCIIKTDIDKIYIETPYKIYSPPNIVTKPYPNFPTDFQPQIMSVLATSQGCCVIKETLFSSRNKHISELKKMGANIEIIDETTFEINGVDLLYGAEVTAKDLRGGAALIISALSAEGESKINGIEHIIRGYENICTKIENIGGIIKLDKNR